MRNGESAELVERWRAGDQDAAAVLFERYASRLIGLVRTNLSEKLARRVDADDIVQSACRSFFIGLRDGRYLLEHSGDLWRLMVSIALHKLYHQVERHTAGKRAVDREFSLESLADLAQLPAQSLGGEASPSQAMVLGDQLQRIMNSLSPQDCRMFELRLEGYTLTEIANDVGRSQRTVRRVMDRIRRIALMQFEESLAT